MHPPAVCPTAEELQRFLLGLVEGTDVVHLENHLSECPTCLERMQNLPANDDLVRAMQTPRPESDTPRPPLVDVLVPLLKRLQPQTLSWHGTPAEDGPPASHPAISVMGPPVEPNELGRIGPYAILEVLGAGGMGVVLRAFDTQLQRTVALKVVRPELVAKPGMVERFLQEAQAIARVEHDNIVVIHAVDNHNGVPCIVMPLLRGQSLEDRLRDEQKPLPLPEVLRIGREIASGLSAAHERGLVHRDIKPGNLWLEEPSGRIKILDFGLAFIRAEGIEGPIGVAGTPGYLSPEQARGQVADHRSDLFSLGCVLYRMATGVSPFADAKTFTALIRVVVDRPKPAVEVNPQLLPAAAELIDRLLAKEPQDRTASAAEVVQAIEAIEQSLAAQRAKVTRRRWMLGIAGAALLGGLSVWAMIDKKAPSPDSKKPEEPAEIEQHELHSQPVMHIAAIPNKEGFAVLSGSLDRTLQWWEPGSKEKSRFVNLPSGFLSMAVTANGKHAATAVGDKQNKDELAVQVWTVESLTATGEPFKAHRRLIRAMAFSPDGKALLTAARGEIFLWNLADRTHKIWEGHEDSVVFAAAFDSEGKRALTGDEDGTAILWDVENQKPIKELTKAHPKKVHAVAFLAKGFATAGDDGVIRIWDEKTFEARELKGHTKEVLALSVSSDGKRLLSGGGDGIVGVWSVEKDEPLYLVKGHKQAVRAVTFSPDGRQAVSGSDDNTVRVWRLVD